MIKHNLADINKILQDYADDIQNEIESLAEETADEGVKKLKNTKNVYQVRSGKYNKNWRKRVEKGFNDIRVTIYNNKYGSLTHLIENGHATRNGGRTKAYKHIEQVEEQVSDAFEKGVEEIIRRNSK